MDKVGQAIGTIKHLDTCEEPFAYCLTGNKQAWIYVKYRCVLQNIDNH